MRKLIALLLAGLMVLAFAGCSKDSKDNVEASSNTTQAAASSSGDEEESEDQSDEESSGGNSGDCPTQDEVDEINAAFDAAEAESATDPAGSVEALGKAFDSMGEYVPDDLQGDFETLRDALDELLTLMAGIDMSDPASMTPEMIADLEAASAAMDNPAVMEASEKIEAYFADACPDILFD